ncbi:MAG: hypothetical protein ACK5MR_02710 [Cumulibacter sp.]
MLWLILGLVVLVLLAVWVTWTAMRIDRLHARVTAAWRSLDAQLVRRSSEWMALQASADQDPPDLATGFLATSPPSPHDAAAALKDNKVRAARPISAHEVEVVAQRDGIDPVTSDMASYERAARENRIGAEIAAMPEAEAHELLRRACTQVQTARTFYNDAVRAYGSLRAQRLPRLFRMGASDPVPPYFDIDDSPGTGHVPGD